MSILATFSPPSMTAEQYDQIVERLYDEGIQPAPGLNTEIAYGSGDQMKVIVLFDTPEQFEAFGARLGPILEEYEMDPGGPAIFEVHKIIQS
jgi:hypothetical protein